MTYRDFWVRMARIVTGPPGGPEWRYRFRRLVGPAPVAIDQPDFIAYAVERGVRPWRERYEARH